MNTLFSSIDIGVIVVYFVLFLGIGFYFSRKECTSTEYFLAGRNVGWIAIGASFFATNISSEHFIGLAGSGASSGLAVVHFESLALLSPRNMPHHIGYKPKRLPHPSGDDSLYDQYGM
jgi:SSS family solute:Na+ symporter